MPSPIRELPTRRNASARCSRRLFSRPSTRGPLLSRPPAAPSQPYQKVTESMAEEYDVVVLGSGEAGKYLAWTLASQGKKVAVIERRYVGGSCPNIACLPSQN